MPNTSVPVTAGGLPKIDRRAVMLEAHRYARSYAGRDWTYRQLLQWGLKHAWERAKDGLTDQQRQIGALRIEIAALTYKPARIDITARRRVIEAQISALAA
ncbi:MAG: hypothetical protein AB7P20_26140 [Rhizobiaceae bacterium]